MYLAISKRRSLLKFELTSFLRFYVLIKFLLLLWIVQIYQAYADYNDMMNIAEELITTCAIDCKGTENITYQVDTLKTS